MVTTAFSRAFAALLADRGRGTAWTIGGAAMVLIAWCAWASFADITMYEVSAAARVELDGAAYPIQSSLAGEVISANLRVGQVVRKGDVLVEINARPDELHRREQQTRALGLEPELVRLRAQVAAEERARTEEQQLARLTTEEAASRLAEAEAALQYATNELTMTEKLRAGGLVSDRDLTKAKTDAAQRQASVAALRSMAQRVAQEQTTRDRERDARIEGLEASIAALDAERTALGAGVDRLAYEIERRKVRAATDGVVAEATPLRPGAVVAEGARLGSLVPSGRLLIAAQFPARAALGRIHAGQRATLRLDGFPWTEFGAVSATVTRVAQEIRDGHIRVELSIEPTAGFRGRLEHGMPGSLEVAVERLTPLALLFRMAGRALTSTQPIPGVGSGGATSENRYPVSVLGQR